MEEVPRCDCHDNVEDNDEGTDDVCRCRLMLKLLLVLFALTLVERERTERHALETRLEDEDDNALIAESN